MDEQDLKTLGGLPELRFLALDVWPRSSAMISNINDSDDACYFPKLRSFSLHGSMLLFIGSKEDMSVSFHIWNGEDDIPMASVPVPDDELQDALCFSPG